MNNRIGTSASQLGRVPSPLRPGDAAPTAPSSPAGPADCVVLNASAGTAASAPVSEASLLQQEYARRFPQASARQCAELADLFGGRFPTFHKNSPSGRKSIFWIPPGEPDQPFGLYRLDGGQGSPESALSAQDARALNQPPRTLQPGQRPHPRDRRTPSERAQVTHRTIRHLAWQPDERRLALTYERGGFGDATILVDFQGGSQVLPGLRTSGPTANPTMWSPDGRWLALQTGSDPHVYFYDAETAQQQPRGYPGAIVGWKGLNLEVQVGDDLRVVMFQEQSARDAAGGLLGDGGQHQAGPVQSGQDEVRIGRIRLPVRKPSGQD